MQSGNPRQARGYKYASFQDYYQDINLDQYSEAEGTVLLLRKYLGAFAPATVASNVLRSADSRRDLVDHRQSRFPGTS